MVDNITFAGLEVGDRVDPMSYIVTIEKMHDGDKVIQLKKPMYALWRKEGKYFFIDYAKLGMYCSGLTYEEAMEDFNENFLCLLEAYVECDENTLAKSGKELRKQLLEYAEL